MARSHNASQQLIELEHRRLVAESLTDILTVLNSNLPLEDTLASIVKQAHPLLGADAAAIYRLQPDKLLTIQSSVGLGEDYIALGTIPLGVFATGQAALELHPIIITDIQEVHENPDSPYTNLRLLLEHLSANYRSILSLPLIIRSETYGTLTLYYQKAHSISKEKIDLAASFANQAALAIENARLRAQVEADAVHAERTRLARELHDSVTQMLFSASMIADVLPIVWEKDNETARKGLSDLRQLTRGALAEMRTLLMELRPNALEEASLEDLLKQLVESTRGRIRALVNIHYNGSGLVPKGVRINFYRIAQEALNNVSKHAEARQVEITINRPSLNSSEPVDQLEMIIVDDGCGFDPNKTSPNHLGISIMKERAQNIGAEISIQSQIHLGTEIKVSWKEQKG